MSIKAREIEWDGFRNKDKYFPFDIYIKHCQSELSDATYYIPCFGHIEAVVGCETIDQAKAWCRDRFNEFMEQYAIVTND